MATLEDVQNIFRHWDHIRIDKKEGNSFIIELDNQEFSLLDTEIDDYLSIKDQVKVHPETAFFMPGYYEHVIDFLGQPGSGRYRLMFRDEEKIQITSLDEKTSLELSGFSIRFILIVSDQTDERTIRLVRRRVRATSITLRRYRHSDVPEPPPFQKIFERIYSIKVESSEVTGLSTLKRIAESGLFNISYARSVGLGLSRSWERSHYRLVHRNDKDIQFPIRMYKSDLLAYYQLALSSDYSYPHCQDHKSTKISSKIER